MADTRDAKCPGCGEVVQVPMCDPPDPVLDRIPLWCDGCFEKEKKRRDFQEFQAKLNIKLSDLSCKGMVCKGFKQHTFRETVKELKRRHPAEVAQAAAWVGPGTIVFAGPTGTGKTTIARCLLRKLFVQDKEVAEVTARDLVYRASRFGEEVWFKRHIHRDALFIDDLDKVDVDEKRLEVLWEIFNARIGKQTIITSNVKMENIKELWLQKAGRNSSLVSATYDRMKPLVEILLLGESMR